MTFGCIELCLWNDAPEWTIQHVSWDVKLTWPSSQMMTISIILCLWHHLSRPACMISLEHPAIPLHVAFVATVIDNIRCPSLGYAGPLTDLFTYFASVNFLLLPRLLVTMHGIWLGQYCFAPFSFLLTWHLTRLNLDSGQFGSKICKKWVFIVDALIIKDVFHFGFPNVIIWHNIWRVSTNVAVRSRGSCACFDYVK